MVMGSLQGWDGELESHSCVYGIHTGNYKKILVVRYY